MRGGVGLLPALPDGSRPVGLGALALDVAIINSLGPSHWDDTLRGAPDAVTAYAQRKRDHLDTAASCQQVGIHYQPLVWDIYGGCTAATRAFLHRLAGLVATVEGIDLTLVKARLLDQLAVVLARGAGRALRRRHRGAAAPPHASGLVAGLLLEP